MAFGDFSFPQVRQDLSLVVREGHLFDSIPAQLVRPDLLSQLELGTTPGVSINTEKARSEFMIAPILLELRRLVGERLGIFSGVPLDGDSSRGLDGICDFLLTTSGMQLMVRGPVVAVVEAKNDNVMNGLGQCIASLVAVRMVNEREGSKDRTVYGVVTTGSAWKFMKLLGSELAIDRQEYSIRDPGKLLAILTAMVA